MASRARAQHTEQLVKRDALALTDGRSHTLRDKLPSIEAIEAELRGEHE